MIEQTVEDDRKPDHALGPRHELAPGRLERGGRSLELELAPPPDPTRVAVLVEGLAHGRQPPRVQGIRLLGRILHKGAQLETLQGLFPARPRAPILLKVTAQHLLKVSKQTREFRGLHSEGAFPASRADRRGEHRCRFGL